ncbi:unnamed protein product [Rotaria magnacalcarata]|uniref:Wax synthase domain-containing protein n=1 Tax=Rotaria magnacalcarata TaxID=392030 RepID=A0A815ZEM6_9BILA|nr:unnamed protein product [Rotaria magnacalcarata]CAF1583574.1 unnamed protein product [Rotaria magnacalcarata]CAF2097880.1 unnamed protein product [Rotaria magnacalcarata]CAF2134519.1 unnamed protein product [Rotaria magnacalcarata]CAF2166761.1 unnamed protein product [Rotaria magnacalcarata]
MINLLLVHVGWLLHIVICFYVIRPIRYIVIRGILALIPCIILTNSGARHLPQHHICSVFAVAIYWMTSIRLIHLTIVSRNKYLALSSFIFKCLWIVFPVVPCQPTDKDWPIILYFLAGILKFIINCWLHRWLLICEPNDSYQRVFIYFLSILTFSYVIDIQTVFMRIITRDKYTFQSLNNFPFSSRSLREFWGRRYNQIIGRIFHESIFQPLNSYMSSRSVVALITFIISGLLHVHIAIVVLNDVPSVLPTFACFFLNGIACCVERFLPNKLPPILEWLITHCVLLITAPMCLGSFARDQSVFFGIDALSSYVDQWILVLPIPTICPK